MPVPGIVSVLTTPSFSAAFILLLSGKHRRTAQMKKEKLFTGFSPVSPAEWKDKIIRDLKGKPYEKLFRHPDEGFDIQPFYQKTHLTDLGFLQSQPGRFPFVRGKNSTGNQWQVNQVIRVKNVKDANREALKAVANGVDALTFVPDEAFQPDKNSLQQLLQHVNTQNVQLHFRGAAAAEWMETLRQAIPDAEKPAGSVENDPLAYYSLHGSFRHADPFGQMEKTVQTASAYPDIKAVTVDGTLFHNAGGSTVSEMAFTLAMGSAYLEQLTDKGFDAGELADKMLFRLAVGSDYFMEMAKFRAFRYLWAQILKAFGVSEEKAVACIHAESSYRNKTVYDPYVNMLRTTTETMSAILGGADVVTVLPFDAAFEPPSEMARRIARNQQLILKEESYFDKVADPAAGSYYIENLTANLIEKSWELFLETDRQGGYLRAFEKGFVRQRIETEARKKDTDVARRRISILGVNQFPNMTENRTDAPAPAVFESQPVPADTPVKPLRIYRAAVPFEKLRYATDRFSNTHNRPRVWLLTTGDLAMRRARAQFAENFFGCAGYEIVDHVEFASAEEGMAAALKEKPEIVVLCSDDKTYEEAAPKVFETLKNHAIVVLAGKPDPLSEKLKAAGMQHFIYAGCNVLETLQQFNKMLGIEK